MKINTLYLLVLVFFTTLNSSDDYFYQNGKKVTVAPLNNLKLFSLDTLTKQNKQYLKTQNGNTLGYDDEILLKTSIDIKTVLLKYDLTLLTIIVPTIYLVQVKDTETILDKANRLYEDKDINFAHPNFTKQLELR